MSQTNEGIKKMQNTHKEATKFARTTDAQWITSRSLNSVVEDTGGQKRCNDSNCSHHKRRRQQRDCIVQKDSCDGVCARE